ncbi:SMP-30/gluconolactonase/LRE family protein [Luteibacter aegosomatissinici]|uniref:SMP-30/gluconolactonase/LRE family protein n=1 Tax=Luteibacter aegosomatissinici TaxID=2911539 RepID=UPI001FF9043E|nr:SMP-30/gluconolactonase/LRE family protein [Luteibacter aegosomatissinici]UPG94587.1 SMP-30/gluconolactonase/LRE family protein [Luteibacter aegosomatissinici]
MSNVHLAAQPRALVGESVRVDGDDIVWLDPPGHRLLRWSPPEGRLTETPLAHPLWSLGQRLDGGWAGAGEDRFFAVDIRSGTLEAGPLAPLAAGCRFNDMTVDASGGLWTGSMHRGLLHTRGGLFHAASPIADVQPVAAGLGVANGMAFVRHGRSLLVIDTLSRTLLAYPVHDGHASLGEPTVVTDFLACPGKPDGMAIAPDGSVWVAMWGGGAIVQLAANGAVERSIAIPAPHVGSLAFDHEGTAYVATSRARLTETTLSAYPGSGGLFVVSGLF